MGVSRGRSSPLHCRVRARACHSDCAHGAKLIRHTLHNMSAETTSLNIQSTQTDREMNPPPFVSQMQQLNEVLVLRMQQIRALKSEADVKEGALTGAWLANAQNLIDPAIELIHQRSDCLAKCKKVINANVAEQARLETSNNKALLGFQKMIDQLPPPLAQRSEVLQQAIEVVRRKSALLQTTNEHFAAALAQQSQNETRNDADLLDLQNMQGEINSLCSAGSKTRSGQKY